MQKFLIIHPILLALPSPSSSLHTPPPPSIPAAVHSRAPLRLARGQEKAGSIGCLTDLEEG
jgi:hypothetical protein